MASSLTNLLVFTNTIQPELVRSVHVYRECNGNEREVEREFLFSERGSYVEMKATPILRFVKFRVSQVCEGYQNGVWLCIFAFHAYHTPQFTHIPSLLLVKSNPKLQAIPNLLNDLHTVYNSDRKEEDREISQDSTGDESKGKNNDSQSTNKVLPVLDQDLNCLPNDKVEDESKEPNNEELQDNEMDIESSPVGVCRLRRKEKRAPSNHIAKIALSDLVKYFGMPIAEASKNLNVGLTVLKRKCREFGIPRWPHRKIKSLDSLIHDLQEEAKRQELEDEAAAMAVERRKKMLESEKENIEKKPFMDIQIETKRFRQDVFKRRHRARVYEKHAAASSTSATSEESK